MYIAWSNKKVQMFGFFIRTFLLLHILRMIIRLPPGIPLPDFLYPPPSCQFLDSNGNIMRQKYHQSHDGNILRKKEGHRPFKVKKHKRGFQKHIRQELIFHKSIESIPGSQNRSHTQNHTQRLRCFFPSSVPCHSKNHIPVQAKMKSHPCKSPECGKHM